MGNMGNMGKVFLDHCLQVDKRFGTFLDPVKGLRHCPSQQEDDEKLCKHVRCFLWVGCCVGSVNQFYLKKTFLFVYTLMCSLSLHAEANGETDARNERVKDESGFAHTLLLPSSSPHSPHHLSLTRVLFSWSLLFDPLRVMRILGSRDSCRLPLCICRWVGRSDLRG